MIDEIAKKAIHYRVRGVKDALIPWEKRVWDLGMSPRVRKLVLKRVIVVKRSA